MSHCSKFIIHSILSLRFKGNYAISFSGTIGHVAHGKSTVVKAISGVQVWCVNNLLL